MSRGEPERAIFVTGAASGIGRATARLFAGRGWLVGAVDVDQAGLQPLQAELGSGHFVSTLDVTDREDYAAVLERFSALSGGRLDLLFNNAGIIAAGPFTQMRWDVVERIVRVNLLGVMIGVHAAAPLLKATPGSLCFSTCSASAIFGSEQLAVYSATKQAVKGFTEALSVELGRDGVRVADVLPGFIDTGMMSPETRLALPTQGPWRMLEPEAVAEAVWTAYMEDGVHWYVPPELKEIHVQAIAAPEAARDMARRAGIGAAAALPTVKDQDAHA